MYYISSFKWYLIVQEFCLSRSMRYAALAFRTLSLLDWMSSSGISVMSLAEWSSVRKCSETVVGLEGGLSTQWRIQCRARPPLFSDKTEAWRAKKKNFGDPPPPNYLRVWMTGAPPTYSRALDLALQLVCGVRWNGLKVKSSQVNFYLNSHRTLINTNQCL